MTASSPGSVKGVPRPEKALTVDRAGSVASATAEDPAQDWYLGL